MCLPDQSDLLYLMEVSDHRGGKLVMCGEGFSKQPGQTEEINIRKMMRLKYFMFSIEVQSFAKKK